MTEEQYLLEQISLIRESYEKAAKPYVDRLIQIRSMSMSSVLIDKEVWDKFQSQQAQRAQLPESPM
jgi:hypothetical protein